MRPEDQGFEEALLQIGGIEQAPDTDANYFNPILWRNGEQLKAVAIAPISFSMPLFNF